MDYVLILRFLGGQGGILSSGFFGRVNPQYCQVGYQIIGNIMLHPDIDIVDETYCRVQGCRCLSDCIVG